MLFSGQFAAIQNSFMAAAVTSAAAAAAAVSGANNNNNNNHEMLNHNHAASRHCRTLTADRKRPYPCNLCPSRFGSKMELEEHQNSHTGQKPFECDVCKARFNRRSTLWNHKRIHSDAKPFVCTVCQMTFKWKNSLKCHKEMHVRKNESSTLIDNDLRQLTYATAAKRRLEAEAGGDGSGGGASAPLITTAAPKKSRPSKNAAAAPAAAAAAAAAQQQQQHATLCVNVKYETSPTSSTAGSAPPNGAASTGGGGQADDDGSGEQQHLLHHPHAHHAAPHHHHHHHHLEHLDTASLQSLVQQNSGNILVQLCGDMDPNLGRHPLLDDTHALLTQSSHIFGDIKGELSLYPSPSSGQSNGMLDQSTTSSPLHGSGGDLPLVGSMFNFRGLHQQLPSVHHLTSPGSLPSAVSVQMDYQADLSHPQYIVTTATQPHDMVLTGPQSYHQNLDQCVVIHAGHEYMPNFDYSLIGGGQLSYDASDATPQMMASVGGGGGGEHGGRGGGVSVAAAASASEGKAIPYERW